MKLISFVRRRKVLGVVLCVVFFVSSILALFGTNLGQMYGLPEVDEGILVSRGSETLLRKAIPVGDRLAVCGSFLRESNLRYQIFFSLLDTSGNELKRFEFGGTGNDTAVDLLLEDDGFVVLGMSRSPNLATIGRIDVVLLKLSPDGNLQWSRVYGSPGSDRAFKIAKTNYGYVFVGDVLTSGGDVPTHAGGFDMWIVHVDRNGKILWSRTYGGRGWDRAFGVTYVPETNTIVVAGPTNSSGSAYVYRSAVLFLNANTGELIAERTLSIEAGGSVWAQDVKVFGGNVYVGGYVSEPRSSGNFGSRFVERAFVAKLRSDFSLEFFKTFGENARLYSLEPLEVEYDVERVAFAGQRVIDESRLPWYGNVTFARRVGFFANGSDVTALHLEKLDRTEYGMFFNVMLNGGRLFFSGSKMSNGRVVGTVLSTDYF